MKITPWCSIEPVEQYHKITPNTTIVLLTFQVCIECKLLWFSCIPCLFYKQDFSRKAHSKSQHIHLFLLYRNMYMHMGVLQAF